MKLFRILLVEDDTVLCEEFRVALQSHGKFKLHGVTNSALDAIAMIEHEVPDILLLDLELHQGKGTGIQVLQAIQHKKILPKPYTIIMTNNSSPIILDNTRKLGADFIIQKHQEDFSVSFVLDFLDATTPSIQVCSTANIQDTLPMENNLPVENEIDTPASLRDKITRELEAMQFKQKHVGFLYLIDAILLLAENYQIKVLKEISFKYHNTEINVTHAMQNAINSAWKTCPYDILREHFTAYISSETGVPTMMEFVSYFANKYRQY